jgi:hypothetical protein
MLQQRVMQQIPFAINGAECLYCSAAWWVYETLPPKSLPPHRTLTLLTWFTLYPQPHQSRLCTPPPRTSCEAASSQRLLTPHAPTGS